MTTEATEPIAVDRAADDRASTRLKITDFVVLQAGWAACVVGAAYGAWWFGPLFVVLAVGIRSRVVSRPARDLVTAAVVSVFGVVADSLQVAFGVVAFPEGPRLGVLPLWIVVLWPLFGSSFHSVLGWLQDRPLLAAGLAAVGGPPGYFAAERLGALTLPQSGVTSFAALGAAWAIVMPLGLRVARRLA